MINHNKTESLSAVKQNSVCRGNKAPFMEAPHAHLPVHFIKSTSVRGKVICSVCFVTWKAVEAANDLWALTKRLNSMCRNLLALGRHWAESCGTRPTRALRLKEVQMRRNDNCTRKWCGANCYTRPIIVFICAMVLETHSTCRMTWVSLSSFREKIGKSYSSYDKPFPIGFHMVVLQWAKAGS